MKLKGTYSQKYCIDNENKELVVEVELKQNNDPQLQNIYFGVATANGKVIKHKDLPYCVNAEHMAEKICLEIIDAWKARAIKEGKSFRLNKK